MGFTKPCVSDEDKVEGIFNSGRVDEGQDVVLTDLGIEILIELLQSLQMFDAPYTEKSFDLILPSIFDLDKVESNRAPSGDAGSSK